MDKAIKVIGEATEAATDSMHELIKRDEKLDALVEKTDIMGDLSYSIASNVSVLLVKHD